MAPHRSGGGAANRDHKAPAGSPPPRAAAAAAPGDAADAPAGPLALSPAAADDGPVVGLWGYGEVRKRGSGGGERKGGTCGALGAGRSYERPRRSCTLPPFPRVKDRREGPPGGPPDPRKGNAGPGAGGKGGEAGRPPAVKWARTQGAFPPLPPPAFLGRGVGGVPINEGG